MYKLNTILMFLLTMLFTACDKEDLVDKEMSDIEPASLSLSISACGLSMQTRGYEDPSSDPSNWTPMERAIDGREIYRLTVFLINKENKLVAYRNIYQGSSDVDASNGFWTGVSVGQNLPVGQKVKVTFNYEVPKHGKVEKLVQGEYTMMVVANYSPYDTYKGLQMSGDFTKIIDGIISDFGTSGIVNFSSRSDFYKYKLDAGTDYVCPQQPQPLSLVKKIALRPGQNEISGDLKRTYARIRINLRNDSQSTLRCHNLSFNDKFAKQRTYLFEDPNDENFVYSCDPTLIGAPNLKSTEAIHTFAPADLTQQTAKVLFDAYILESKNDNSKNYTYTLNLEYVGESALLSETPISTMAEFKDFFSKTQTFFIKQERSKYFLKNDGTDKVAAESKTINDLQTEKDTDPNSIKPFIWELSAEPGGTGAYCIKSLTGNYINNLHDEYYSLNWITYNNNPVYHHFGTRESYDEIVIFQNYYYSFYLTISTWGTVESQNGADDYTSFVFYPLKFATFNRPIQIQTIDPITSKSTEVNAIKRNDFINIFVTSNYSRTNGIQAFTVKDWDQKDVDISYN